jgi:hypothetical protein
VHGACVCLAGAAWLLRMCPWPSWGFTLDANESKCMLLDVEVPPSTSPWRAALLGEVLQKLVGVPVVCLRGWGPGPGVSTAMRCGCFCTRAGGAVVSRAGAGHPGRRRRTGDPTAGGYSC